MQFPTVLVINLDHRQDRWLAIQKMCHAAGIRAERVSAVKRSPGWHGCAMSHIKCAKLAKERRLPWVLVLEDDCEFSQQDFARFARILPVLWTNIDKWEYFNGGITFVENPELIESTLPLIKANGFTTHFILYNNKAYDKIASWTPAGGPCDVYFDKMMKSVTTFPLIARQTIGQSDINNSEQDYNGFFNKAENTLKNFLQSKGLLNLG